MPPRCGGLGRPGGTTLAPAVLGPGDPPFGIGGCVGGWDRGVLGRGKASATTGRPCTFEVVDSEEGNGPGDLRWRRILQTAAPPRFGSSSQVHPTLCRREETIEWTGAGEESQGMRARGGELFTHSRIPTSFDWRAAGVVSRAERRQAGGGDVFGRCKGEPPRELVAERGRRSKDETILREISIRRRGTPRPGFASGDGRGSPRDREEGGVDQEDQNLFSTTEGVRFSSLRRLRRWVGQEMEGLRLDAPLADGGVLPAQACIPRTGSLSAG
ncbi:hypothetical protein THAOC_09571 [Thalassiosira oceanica]|uniref:Uncharacterized protein n=1 Tax=Thalassiosira oceanica TaxID=159749 RepID=K0T7E7_THAOC|nr:hypothetical protein THAOC_09571 [Thalassiosira oceanica]|eukprot:EJK69196.1 hypothetical protein THAOC_09571 [Thalassiosira oceanica]